MTNNISETNFKIYNNNYKITDEMFSLCQTMDY